MILAPAGLALGVAAERAAFAWDDPQHWVPDLVVGLTFVGAGSYAMSKERGTGALLAATGFAWFLGTFDSWALYLHRGPLVHVVATYRGWRPRSRLELATVIAGYAASLAMPVWRSEATAIVLTVCLVGVVAGDHFVATGAPRRDRLIALQVTVALGVILAVGAVVRLAVPSGDAVEPMLLLYQAVLCGVAIRLAAGVRVPPAAAITDLVVELSETPSGTLRDALARMLRDPTLEVGYWSL